MVAAGERRHENLATLPPSLQRCATLADQPRSASRSLMEWTVTGFRCANV